MICSSWGDAKTVHPEEECKAFRLEGRLEGRFVLLPFETALRASSGRTDLVDEMFRISPQGDQVAFAMTPGIAYPPVISYDHLSI